MLITHIITGLEIGGAELVLKRLIESHHENPYYDHAVVSLTTVGKVGHQLRALGIQVQAMGMRSPLDIPRTIWQLARYIRRSRPDIVQTWMYHADLIGGIAARVAGNRNVIWGVRTTEVKAGGRRSTRLVRQACTALSHVVPHSIVCAAEVSRRFHAEVGYRRSRMLVVPNGFDLSRLTISTNDRLMLRSQCGFAPSDVVIGSLGRFNAAKDHENFVRAAIRVATERPEVKFLMVGREVDGRNVRLNSLISQAGMQERFVLLGEREDVPVCLAAMDIFCMHSRNEGFPNVVGEAMAMGLPCVVTDVGDAAMLIAENGVVVPKEDAAALARGLLKLVDMPGERRKELGQNARARIKGEFTMERARERFEAVYRQVLTEDPS